MTPPEDELKGAPVHARLKTYSAETGFVYQYVYRGQRRLPAGDGAEYVFEASCSSRQLRIRVHLLDSELERCVLSVGRELIAAERYALVKMTLFAALDEFREISELETPLVPEAVQMEAYLRTLGRL